MVNKIRKQIEESLVDESIHKISLSAEKSRKKLLVFSLITILYIIFEPGTPITYLGEYFSINSNKDLIPFAWLALNIWFFSRYYLFLSKEELITTGVYFILKSYFNKSPIEDYRKRSRNIYKYYGHYGELCIRFLILYPEQMFFYIFKSTIGLISSLFVTQRDYVSKHTLDLEERIEDAYQHGGWPSEDMEDALQRLEHYKKIDRQISDANNGLFNMDVKLPLFLGLVSIAMLIHLVL